MLKTTFYIALAIQILCGSIVFIDFIHINNGFYAMMAGGFWVFVMQWVVGIGAVLCGFKVYYKKEPIFKKWLRNYIVLFMIPWIVFGCFSLVHDLKRIFF